MIHPNRYAHGSCFVICYILVPVDFYVCPSEWFPCQQDKITIAPASEKQPSNIWKNRSRKSYDNITTTKQSTAELLECVLTLIPAWINNNIHYTECDEFIYPFPNFNGCTIEILKWMSNFTLHFNGHVIRYPCRGYCLSVLAKDATGAVTGRSSNSTPYTLF